MRLVYVVLRVVLKATGISVFCWATARFIRAFGEGYGYYFDKGYRPIGKFRFEDTSKTNVPNS